MEFGGVILMKKRFKKNFVSLKLVCLATGVLFSLKFLKNLDHSDYVEKIQDKIEDEIDELFLEEKYQDYFNYFKNVKLNYNREDLYSTKEELLTIINYQKYSSCQYNFDEDIKKLVSIIVENTEDYLSSHHEFRNPFDRQFLDEALLDVDFLMLLERTLDELFINAENDFAEDVCRMQDLKIVLGSIESKKDTITMASFLRRENVIIVSDEAILKVLSNAGVINDSVIEKEMIHVLKHELNHVRQLDCLCIRNSKNIINNLRYDELYVPFYVESSAESAIYNEGQWNKDAVFLNELSIEYTYYTERKFESLLQLLSIFDESVGLNDYYEAIFSGDFFKMYQFLGLTDEDEIYDFYKIVYSMDAILGRNKFSYECYNKNEVSFEEKKRQ